MKAGASPRTSLFSPCRAIGAFDLALFAALVGDDDDDLDDLTSEQIEAARRANLEGGGHRRNDCLNPLARPRGNLGGISGIKDLVGSWRACRVSNQVAS